MSGFSILILISVNKLFIKKKIFLQNKGILFNLR